MSDQEKDLKQRELSLREQELNLKLERLSIKKLYAISKLYVAASNGSVRPEIPTQKTTNNSSQSAGNQTNHGSGNTTNPDAHQKADNTSQPSFVTPVMAQVSEGSIVIRDAKECKMFMRCMERAACKILGVEYKYN